MIVSYSRVSTVSQNLDRQQVALENFNIEKSFEDKCSGKDTNREQLQAMLDFVREGDSIICLSLDRLARNLQDLLSIIEKLNAKGVSIKFIKENLEFNPKSPSNAMSTLTLQIFGAFAQWERSVIKERQMNGIAIAKAKGVYKGRKRIDNAKFKQVDELVEKEGISVVQGCKRVGISKATYYLHKKDN